VSAAAPETVLWNMLRGAMTTKALGIAADLRIAQRLAGGRRHVDDLGDATGADPSALRRILRALASDGVFAETDEGVFRNTEASELLLRDGWSEFAHLFGSVFYDATRTTDPRTSEETIAREFGTDFWSWLETKPAERRAFDAAMAGGKERTVDRLAQLEWRADEVVADIGGGNGALLRALLDRQPELRGIVFDLPETVRDESRLGDRIEFVAGSFFESVPAADVYVLSGILHNWDDERATTILRTIRAAANEGARLVLAENVIATGNEPQGSKWLDLLMLVIGGRERSDGEWRALLDNTGFDVESVEDGLIRATCR
jgi:hypothetical protein